jgi:putative ABC transport system permease protein
MELQSPPVGWMPVKTQVKNVDPTDPWVNMGFDSQESVLEYGEIVEGAWPKPSTSASAPIQVAVLDTAADTQFLNVGDIYKYKNYQVQITGIWKAKNPNASIWFDLPTTAFASKWWIPQETYSKLLGGLFSRPVFYTSWYVIIDDTIARFDEAPEYARGLVRLDTELRRILPGITTDYSPLEALSTYQQRADSLTTLFYAVGGPMVVLALLFISLTASIAVQAYEQETATMRGRGTSWWQVVLLNLIESLILIVAAVLPSLLVGWLAAEMISKTLSFLQFTDRPGIPFTFVGVNLIWLGASALLIVSARLMPALGISRTTIVRVKQDQNRSGRKPLWQRFYLDFLLLLPGVYAYLTMSGLAKSNKFLSQLQVPTNGQYRDILLYVAPALFAMALCMILLRILPLITRILAAILDRVPGVWAYLSLQQIARRPQDHASALLLIMISLSLAIFSASTAKTLDKWNHDSAYYKSGADLAIHEYIVSGGSAAAAAAPGGGGSATTTLSDLDASFQNTPSVEDHLNLPSIENITRVGKYSGTFSFGAGERSAVFMGIDRLDFPAVAFYRDDFARMSLGALMNQLGSDQLGVLIPRDMATDLGLRVGDHLLSTVSILEQQVDREFIVEGFYDYFPTIFPAKDPTLIVNLESLFDNPDSVVGYDLWLHVRQDTETPVLLYQIQKMIGLDRSAVKVSGNAFNDLKVSMDQPERVGVFGVLNVGFIMTGLMPGIGFVLYSYASLRRRFIQLGILQAIGLSVKQLIGYLALEQTLLMGLAIASGAFIGLITSQLFVPFLQVGSSPGAPIPPFEVLIGWSESAWLSLGFGLVLFMTMVGTILSLIRIKVFQAVKMGESL